MCSVLHTLVLIERQVQAFQRRVLVQQAVGQPRVREEGRHRHQQRHGEDQATSGRAATSPTSFGSFLS